MDEQVRIAIRGHLIDIDHQIAVLKTIAADEGVPLSQVRLPDGSWPIIPLLLAKSEAFNALAVLTRK